ncbi:MULTISPECIES: DUF6932 family protein [Sphingobacterium]|uniref:DUF6932 family protein n=1 Tax=Sphingobacterium TaxID=28453 RepID=UPI00104C89A8|nr:MULTISPECIES: hypothetical protein [Sphingobacterium]MCW2262088.1 hypothetical protein [Sphingobacterium kitahiroshimense]TCR13165.1 hypothetical protein EDF67_102579 [Sphingobacterium sp. JUb78]
MNIVFDEDTGLLVVGEHRLALDKFEEIFAHNEHRRYIFERFGKLLEIFKQISCSHIYVDGSFVTKKPRPNDIDVCWHKDEDREKRNIQLETLFKICPELILLNDAGNRKLIQDQFCADVFPANTTEGASGLMFKDFFQRDKNTNQAKGIIIIDLP